MQINLHILYRFRFIFVLKKIFGYKICCVNRDQWPISLKTLLKAALSIFINWFVSDYQNRPSSDQFWSYERTNNGPRKFMFYSLRLFLYQTISSDNMTKKHKSYHVLCITISFFKSYARYNKHHLVLWYIKNSVFGHRTGKLFETAWRNIFHISYSGNKIMRKYQIML